MNGKNIPIMEDHFFGGTGRYWQVLVGTGRYW